VGLWLGVQLSHERAELLHGDEALGVFGYHVLRGWELAAQQLRHSGLFYPAPLLQDDVLHAPLDLEKDR
jgi:hypothetical protein